ncbi:PREDICTED: spermatogenesis-associated protein 22 [Haliaeetus leucocephalus]|uniref:spermatogenesis-associated protein 22 n=1 Tax=Haliaeetus leucocephalus TaxID=52644 RepID=UPI000522BFF7|nr:PREDICTED: spermatogenesis-associated protein 22 [Haliaeetus albicilla]XP_010572030.1 PREDICTED: spermatogenesis-associated protein 22 [Haliaeetus leucocephalus]
MKRSLADTSTRSTAGCLPVPLFNQKKRNRQPITSNPLKNEPGTSSGTRTYDFSPTSLGWGTANPEVTELQKAANNGTKVWNRNEYTPLSNTTDSRSDSGIIRKFESFSNSLKTVQQQKNPDNRNSSQHIKITETSQTYISKGQWPVKPNTASRSLQDHSLAYKFNHNIQQNKMNEKQYGCIPEGKSQEVSSSQLKSKEKKNSLRIISAVIESMRHWSQYAYKTALLFEVLGTLDSAVTPGAYGAKNFLLRDGKESLPCVFYEIDRELPRLIRGRVHRCMGNYDAKRNIFKCVSVRPATIQEQNTFQEFVKISDVEMTAYVKTINEI